jgi:hypothetical protein
LEPGASNWPALYPDRGSSFKSLSDKLSQAEIKAVAGYIKELVEKRKG